MKESENIMCTSSMIGIYNKEDGTVTASYCHYDGYLAYNGAMLTKNYNTQYDAETVAKGGYLSSLMEDYMESRADAVHNEPAVNYASVDVFLKCGDNHAGAEYLYLFDGEAWFYTHVYSSSRKERRFEEVEMNLTETLV
jgi:hypothetical protein